MPAGASIDAGANSGRWIKTTPNATCHMEVPAGPAGGKKGVNVPEGGAGNIRLPPPLRRPSGAQGAEPAPARFAGAAVESEKHVSRADEPVPVRRAELRRLPETEHIRACPGDVTVMDYVKIQFE